MKKCDICKVNPIKVLQTAKGDLCWYCYYKVCFGSVRGIEKYVSRFGKDGVKDEKK